MKNVVANTTANDTADRQQYELRRLARMTEFNPPHAPFVLPCVSLPVPAYSNSVPMPNTKIPSCISGGFGHGIKRWPDQRTTLGQLRRYAADDRLGWGVHCRHIRAIDVDVDGAWADEFRRWLTATTRLTFVVRTRTPSPEALRTGLPVPRRVVLLYRSPTQSELPDMPDDYRQPKVVVTTQFGDVEFLGDGNFVALEGRHYDKLGRYDADYVLPWRLSYAALPVITPEQYRWLVDEVTQQFGIAPAARATNTPVDLSHLHLTDEGDRQTAYVREHVQVLQEGKDGRLYVRCPWADSHTTPNRVMDAMFIGENNKTGGAFYKCLHAHCANRRASEFLSHIGYTFFDPPTAAAITTSSSANRIAVTTDPTDPAVVTTDTTDCVAVTVTEAAYPNGIPPEAVWPPVNEERTIAELNSVPVPSQVNGRGDLLPTLSNAVELLLRPDRMGVDLVYDEFTAEMQVREYKHGKTWQPMSDHMRAVIALRLSSFGLELSESKLRTALAYVSGIRRFDSAKRWLKSLEWDGTNRLPELVSRGLSTTATPYTKAVVEYMLTAMAGRLIRPGVQADMIPIMVSPQGTQKTKFVAALAPFPDWHTSIDLAASDADITRLTLGKVIIELPELRGLKTRDLDHIKAWVTTKTDAWVPKYKEDATNRPRRWLAIGNANDQYLFADPTGNRRWLPFSVGFDGQLLDVDWTAANVAQLWAQGAWLYGQCGVLYAAAERLGAKEKQCYRYRDAWEPVIRKAVEDMPTLPGVARTAWLALRIPPDKITDRTMQRVHNILLTLSQETNRRIDVDSANGSFDHLVIPINEDSLTQIKTLN